MNRLFAQIKSWLKFVQFVAESKTGEKIMDPHHYQACPSIQPIPAVLMAGRVTANGALVGTELQSRVADGKYECRYTSVLEWGDLGVGICATWSYRF